MNQQESDLKKKSQNLPLKDLIMIKKLGKSNYFYFNLMKNQLIVKSTNYIIKKTSWCGSFLSCLNFNIFVINLISL